MSRAEGRVLMSQSQQVISVGREDVHGLTVSASRSFHRRAVFCDPALMIDHINIVHGLYRDLEDERQTSMYRADHSHDLALRSRSCDRLRELMVRSP